MSDLDKVLAGLAPPKPIGGEARPPRSPLDQVLSGDADDERAVDTTDADFRALEDEWRHLAALKERRDRLKDELSEASAAYESQKARMLGAMEAQGTRQYASAEGRGSGSIARQYRTKVVDDQAFLTWTLEHHPELLSVNAQRRDSFIRNTYRDEGVAPDDPSFPPGIEVNEHEVLMVRNVRAATQKDD